MFEFFKVLLCNHFFEYNELDKRSLHSQMICNKCGKKKYIFEH